MAIPKEFINSLPEPRGLRANKDFTRFYYRFKIESKEYATVIDFNDKSWDKKTRKTNATIEAIKYKKSKAEWNMDFTLDTKFKILAEKYIQNKCKQDTKWTQEKKTMLEHYIYPHIGTKKASLIKEMDIDQIRLGMESKGFGVQNKDGCSSRTIRKVLLQVLKPVLEYGLRNGALKKVPNIDVPDKPKKKKVTNATSKIVLLYKSIHTLYKDDPFYRALFLFVLFGRRWNEIRTLEWTDIDFSKNEFTIREENAKINETKTYSLPKDIKEALILFQESSGLVFKSPKTGELLSPPKWRVYKLREASGIDNFTLHYSRHILATTLSDSGLVNTVLSASLGHNNSQTVDNYYRTANSLKGSKEATQAIENIIETETIEVQ